VLLVAEIPTSLDDGEFALRQDLESRGMTVTVVDGNAPASAAAGHHLVLVSSAEDPTTFAAAFKDVPVPMVVLASGFTAPLGFIAPTGSYGSITSMSQLTIADASTTLSADLALGTTFVAIDPTRDTSLYWNAPGGSPIRVATVAATPSQVVVYGFERGAAMANGTAAARRAALGWRNSSFSDLTVPGYQLALAAMRWAVTLPP
jgi:hypothetical protein